METKERMFKLDEKECTISFNVDKDHNMMVNATEMAKIFGKDLFKFTKSDHAKAFMAACQKPPFGGLLGVKSEEDLIVSRQKSGTWMHEILALKFAAWLDPDFEVWVYFTIRDIMFETYKEDEQTLKKIAGIQDNITEKEKELKNSPILREIEELKKKEQQEKRIFEMRKRNRIAGFRTIFPENEMDGKTKK